jgi:hypothetical protein
MSSLKDNSPTIRVLVPVGRDPAPAAPVQQGRIHSKDAAIVIGLLDNHKHNSEQILDRLQQRLSERYAGARFVRAKKPEAGKSAPTNVLESLAAQCHAVVNGVAD